MFKFFILITVPGVFNEHCYYKLNDDHSNFNILLFFLKVLTGILYSSGITWHQSKEEHDKEIQLLP